MCDISSDVALGILPSASSGRAVEGRSPNPEPEAKSKRRSARNPASVSEDASLESAEEVVHQIDQLT